jgi:hypothetical protein
MLYLIILNITINTPMYVRMCIFIAYKFSAQKVIAELIDISVQVSYMYIYVYIYVYLCTTYILACMVACIYMHVYIYSIYIYIYIYMYLYIYICIEVIAELIDISVQVDDITNQLFYNYLWLHINSHRGINVDEYVLRLIVP